MWYQTRVTEQLQLQYPIVQGPFGGGISSVELTAAVSNCGGLGSYGAHILSPEQIRSLVASLKAATKKTFSVNLWVPLPQENEVRISEEDFRENVERLRPYYEILNLPTPKPGDYTVPKFEEQVWALLESQPPVCSFIFGLPSKQILKECRQRGIKTMATVTNVDEALAAEEAGVDILVVSGSEAGGHRSSFLRDPLESPAVSALVPQVKDLVRLPIIAAGGIADGRGVTAALAFGAEGVQVGTAFLACRESNASDVHRAELRSPHARATRLTKVFSGRYARGIKNQFMEEMQEFESFLPAYPIQNWFTQPIRTAAGKSGRPEFQSLWAGQNAPLVRYDRAEDVFRYLLEDTDRVLNRLRQFNS